MFPIIILLLQEKLNLGFFLACESLPNLTFVLLMFTRQFQLKTHFYSIVTENHYQRLLFAENTAYGFSYCSLKFLAIFSKGHSKERATRLL